MIYMTLLDREFKELLNITIINFILKISIFITLKIFTSNHGNANLYKKGSQFSDTGDDTNLLVAISLI